MTGTSQLARLRLVTIVTVAALIAGLIGTAVGTYAREAPNPFSEQDFYINYVAPQYDRQSDGKEVQKRGGIYRPKKGASAYEIAMAIDAKFAQGNPRAARQLAKLERQAIKLGTNPRQIKQAKGTQEAKLLTILVEFNPDANDDFTGQMVPETVFESRDCVPGTIQNGPLHNNIPDPSTYAHEDNNTFWVEDFSSEHFNTLLYTDEGITERVRTDLTGPDGDPGVDISGFTMKRMYEEMSKGAYTVTGAATPWVMVPHSEAFYGASICQPDGEGGFVAPIPQAMRDPGQMAVDAIDALAAQDPSFPWADYDIEDQGDVDGDGNFLEPDGVVDHLVLVHAGEDKSGGGGAQGIYAIWAHSSAVAGGYDIPGTDFAISNYIVQPEDSGVGVFAHEYGHDLGLPDWYDTSGAGDSDVDFWDLMASGSHTGPIFQSMPTHMGLWDKWVLGWADPLILTPGKDARDVQLGQTSNTPRGTKDGIKINLPNKVVTKAVPHSGASMWYGGNDQDWADVKLARTVAVPNAADAKFWMWNNYVIEEDWDFGFVEVSTDGGTTWTELKIFDEAGNLVSTDDGYSDPNGRMHDYGDKKYGLTGDSHGWRHDYVNLAAYAGQTIGLRLRYATDAGFLERGWFADDFAVTGGGVTTWTDDAETDGDWVTELGTFTNTNGAGWHRDSGTSVQAHYYLAEWRNHDGFDEGLKYAYDTNYLHDAWKVQRVPYNAPGMLVWYRDTTYGGVNHVALTTFDLPSTGSKGGLLLVDSHFDPLRRQGEAAVKDPSTLNNLPSRPQSSNAAFSLNPTYPFTECFELLPAEPFSEYCTSFGSLPPVSAFSDAVGWYPGLELRANGSLFFRDIDASTVLPSVGNARYSTRFVFQDGTPLPQFYGIDLGSGILLGSGNPSEGVWTEGDPATAGDDVSFGVSISIVKVAKDNTYATVHVVPAP